MRLRNRELSPRLRVPVVLPFLLVAGFLWTRDAPPPVGAAAAAARAFEARPGQAGNRYVCRRYASGDDGDLYGLAGAQFQCDPSVAPARCRPGRPPDLVDRARSQRPDPQGSLSRRSLRPGALAAVYTAAGPSRRSTSTQSFHSPSSRPCRGCTPTS